MPGVIVLGQLCISRLLDRLLKLSLDRACLLLAVKLSDVVEVVLEKVEVFPVVFFLKVLGRT